MALCPGMPRLGQNATCNTRADQLMPGDAFVARSFPSDTSLEIPYRPVPEQNHAGNTTSALSIKKGCAPIRGLRSKSRPFVVVAKLSVPITFRDYFQPMFHPSLLRFLF